MKQLFAFLMAMALAGLPGSSTLWSQTTPNPNASVDWPVAWIARLALSQHVLDDGQASVFIPRFVSHWGYGGVVARHLDPQGNILSTSPWPDPRATTAIEGQDPVQERRLFTLLPSGVGTPFTWDTLAPGQQALLGDAVLGPQVLRYLRGDRALEAPKGSFRVRTELLGAVVHSSVLHWRHDDGSQRIYFGASDGMLHALDARTGREQFAYLPSMLLPRMATLTQSGRSAAPMVDGPLAMADLLEPQGTRTVLVGGLGAGGAGLFALDTMLAAQGSETEAARAVLWEITPLTPGFANLGETHALPRFTRLNDPARTPAVVVGNGYFNAGNRQASLYVVHALTGALIAELPTNSGDAERPNGLSSPTLADTDGDGVADRAYAGDLLGQLWRFDLRATSLGSIPPRLMFQDPTGTAITTAPVVTRHPMGGQMVVFGTGRTLTRADLDDQRTHHVYGLWDGAPASHNTWLDQSFTELPPTTDGQRWRRGSTLTPNWSSTSASRIGHLGWRLALPAGERLVGDRPLLADGLFTFSSTNPSRKSDPGAPPGQNWLNQVQVMTGGAPPRAIWDTNADGAVDPNDHIEAQVINSRHLGTGVVSQPVLADAGRLGQTYVNHNPELTIIANSPSTTQAVAGGIAGGHFDVDIHYKAGKTFGTQKHQHEYDDRYNVVGMNFNNPSDGAFAMGKAISASTEFKVLVLNAYLNPASHLSVANAPFAAVKEFQGQAKATDASFINTLPSFTRATIEPFVWRLPPDAFASKDWWQDGGQARAGLMPTETGCVKPGPFASPGPEGSLYNGALTLQLVKRDTPASALEPNAANQDPGYGWRVKAGERSKWLLAEYTAFWHHPGNGCFGSRLWKPNPSQDTAPSRAAGSTPTGSGDPIGLPGEAIALAGIRTSANASGLLLLFTDGRTANTNAAEAGLRLQYRDGTTTDRLTALTPFLNADARATPTGPRRAIPSSGRYNWREFTPSWTEASAAPNTGSR